MNRHPAHQIAETVMYAAEELRGYMDPDDPFPWELTEDDHLRAILPRLRHAIWAIAGCIDGIAQATADEHAKRQLTGSVQAGAGCDGIEEAQCAMEGASPGAEPGARHHGAARRAGGQQFPAAADRRRAPAKLPQRRRPGRLAQRPYPGRARRARGRIAVGGRKSQRRTPCQPVRIAHDAWWAAREAAYRQRPEIRQEIESLRAEARRAGTAGPCPCRALGAAHRGGRTRGQAGPG